MKRTYWILFLLILSPCVFAQTNDEILIRRILSAQVVEWNKGNIEGFMKGYWENDSLVFIGKNGPTYGFNQTLLRYKKSYPDSKAMGKLTSTILSMKRLSEKYYFVIGHWQLERANGNIGGSYTLLIENIKGNWVIINDHSS